MLAELEYFSAMVFYGVTVSLCYHMLLFFRAVIIHPVYAVDAEDILFFLAAGFFFFLTAYEKNDGILRWYAFAGAGIGSLAYVRTAGKWLDGVRKWLLQKCRKKGRIKQKKSRKGQVSADEEKRREGKRKQKKRS